ncbi:Short chain dehydrogenase [Colletotrichum higginsianum IMI 349063]|uniref:Short chain dehydrogenase n=3 Tax=Colletotrichum higginsianum TaxID=80884 RepID=A0A1B7YDY1_COLHI|nr:Short chain dehydrogenase [Colletotrichum higginsianum IMI 349063]OBR10229.1 Short chain dehydrogenase [Colletotrichum higginsianum IMI 349063]TID07381.1 putative oxidoreductase YusZ [Colletotrichum higginsianum]GJD02758.1 short chain dehydrogenase [Colletotrichum higginsianum]
MDSPVWFITGASSGFGLAIAKEALSRGHRVIATARNPSNLSDLASAGADLLPLDVTADEATVTETVNKAFAIHGKVTHVINSAGYILDGTIEEANAQEVFDSYNTNVFGALKVCRAVAPHLRAQRFGIVVNIGSVGSWAGGAAVALYCSTKAAVSIFTEGFADEMKPFGVDVCALEPGYFRTRFLNAGTRTKAKLSIDAYNEGPAGDYKKLLEVANNNQAGDPLKGARVVVDVMTKSGSAEGRDIPVRLILGTDCLAGVRQKCKDTLALLDEWESVSASTNF